jgi:hypothetical protein
MNVLKRRMALVVSWPAGRRSSESTKIRSTTFRPAYLLRHALSGRRIDRRALGQSSWGMYRSS